MKKARQKIEIIWKLLDRRKKIVLCNTPIHENIGDQAIAIAERIFIREYFRDFQFIEIEEEICQSSYLPQMMKLVSKNDILFLQGGGFMGDLWPRHENTMRRVIRRCPNSIKIIFPQTCYFEDSSKEIVENYSKQYNEIENLYFFAREKKSFKFFSENFLSEDKCFLVPDIVLSLNCNSNTERKGILLCIRDDKEGLVSKRQRKIIEDYVKKMGKEFDYISTINSAPISVDERDKEFNRLLCKFQSTELVITDRLHGMIFSAITGTPCVALDNLSHKVSGVAEWITDCEYIKCIDFKEMNGNLLRSVMNTEVSVASAELLKECFERMAMTIRKIYEEK